MAPPKGSKRGPKAAASAQPAAKKPKIDRNMVGVLDALKQSEDLPPECRAMLEAGVPWCLGTPASERHKLQTLVLSWMEKTFDDIQARLQEAVERADSEVAASDAKREALETKVVEAKLVVDEQATAVKGKQTELAAAQDAVQSAHEKLEAALATQKSGDAELTKTSDAKRKLEAAMAEDLSFLKREEGFEATQAKAHMKKLTPIAKQLKLDQSLLTAFPSASTQAPSKRGIFDVMVLERLEADIQGRLEELGRILKAGESSAAERAAAVAAALSQVEEASKSKGDAEAAVSAAQAEGKEATDALAAAMAARDASIVAHEAVLSAKGDKDCALDNFQNYHRECFRLFCSPLPATEEATAES